MFTTQYLLQGGDIATYVIVIGAMLLIFYLLMWRPQKKERQKHQQMIQAVRKNDKVVTMGGVHGIVSAVKDNVIILKIDENSDVSIRVNRSSIGAVIPEGTEESESKE